MKPPMKAVLHDRPFSDPDWVFERKLDGIRCLARRAGERVTLESRSGRRLSSAYPELVEALARDRARRFVVDGEIVAFDRGVTSFAKLQGRMGIHDPERARASGIPVFLYLFDVLELGGRDVTGLPLRERKALLRRSFDFRGPVRFTPHRNADGERFFRQACERGWEGLIAKRADSRYVHTRSRDWLKLKCGREQELVVGGWTAPKGSRTGLGALLVGYYDGDRLRYAGKVGTGFDRPTLERLTAELERRELPEPPFADPPRGRSGMRWARPELVAQVAFTEWTRDGKLRHPRYVGLRDDKPAREVVRE